MNPTLKSFYENEPVRKELYDFMIKTLEEMVIERAFAGKPVADLAEARKVINKTFSNLEGKYGIRKKTTSDPR
jgi:hypothetical protein